MNNLYFISDILQNKIRPRFLYILPGYFSKGRNIGQSSHPFFELIYITKGTGIIIIEKQKNNLKKDDLIILWPNDVHQEICSTKEPMETIYLGVDCLASRVKKTTVSERIIKDKSKLPNRIRCQDNKKILLLLRNIQSVFYHKKCYSWVIDNYLIKIFSIILKKYKNIKIKPKNLPDEKDKLVEKAEYYITKTKYYKRKITLKELSEQVHLSPYYFCRLYKQKTGYTPIKHLQHIKIDLAKKLISNPKFTLKRIAYDLNYSDVYHFSKVFKNITGISPGKYRKQIT